MMMKNKYKRFFAFLAVFFVISFASLSCFAESVDDTPTGWLMKFVYDNSGESTFDPNNNMKYYSPGSKHPYHTDGMGGEMEAAIYELPPITIFASSAVGDEYIVHLSDYPVADLNGFDDYDFISNGGDPSELDEIPRSISFYDYYLYNGIDITWTMDGDILVNLTYNDGMDYVESIVYFEVYYDSTYAVQGLDPTMVESGLWNGGKWFESLGGQLVLVRDSDSLYQSAYDRGYNNGQSDGFQTGKDVGYEVGYQQGELNGDEAGYNRGYESGKQAGFAAADTSTAWMNLRNMIFSIFDAPLYALQNAFDFEIFGINLGGFFLSLLGIGVLLMVYRFLMHKKE